MLPRQGDGRQLFRIEPMQEIHRRIIGPGLWRTIIVRSSIVVNRNL